MLRIIFYYTVALCSALGASVAGYAFGTAIAMHYHNASFTYLLGALAAVLCVQTMLALYTADRATLTYRSAKRQRARLARIKALHAH